MTNSIWDFLQKKKIPMALASICEATGSETAAAEKELAALIETGRIVATKKGKYTTSARLKLVPCRAISSSAHLCFGRPLDGGEDIYLDMPNEKALNGDTVLVSVTQGGDRPRGEVVCVTHRMQTELVGTLQFLTHPAKPKKPVSRRKAKHEKKRKVEAAETILPFASVTDVGSQILVQGDLLGAKSGDMCQFHVDVWPHGKHEMRLSVIKVLGPSSDVRVHLRAVILQHGFAEDFPEDVLRASAALPDQISAADCAGRLDLREKTIFTIDGADAKDFDDAVSLEIVDGKLILGVHIADVSHYVRPSTPIDTEAQARGTSVYMPGMTLPMLPEKLSNGLCSLRPNEDRLTFSLLMTMDDTQVIEHTLTPAVIRSCARLTYDDVNHLFAGEENSVPAAIHQTLNEMNTLAKKLAQLRHARGAIDFDLPEAEFDLDAENRPIGIHPAARGDSNRLIEEFMLLANETVAKIARQAEIPFPYRIHEAPNPEKLLAFEDFLVAINAPRKIGDAPSPKLLQKTLDSLADTPEIEVIRRMLLRAMSKARYSDAPAGHYGLADPDYCHFTSPIRRYPDLIAHRMLKRSLSKQARAVIDMRTLTAQASEREYAATLCERDADQIMAGIYMSTHLEEDFTATVTGMSRRGLFLTLANTIEGMLPFASMDDEYESDEDRTFVVGRHTHTVIRLGETLPVRVDTTDPATGDITFLLRGRG